MSPHTAYIVCKDYPDIFMEIERVFLSEEAAHNYIVDRYPYYKYYSKEDFYAMPDLSEEDLKTEERYLIMERPISE
jgi:hypothetical protein